jgi:Fe/S biogenesis protein NfuA
MPPMPDTDTTTARTVIEITPPALEQILELRSAEEHPDDLGLGLRIAGVSPNGFAYETAFLPLGEFTDDDVVEEHGALRVGIPQGSVGSLQGAVLDLSGDAAAPGLVIRNPNPPTPGLDEGGIPDLDPDSPIDERVAIVLDRQINPAIAAHGGYAELAGVDGTTVYLRLGGGCQGCGLAALTLRQGIEAALRQAIPEIGDIVDATDHASGTNPFYQ